MNEHSWLSCQIYMWLYIHGFISVHLILFHWAIHLFLCQCHTVLITIALWYSLKPGRGMPLAMWFFLRIALAFQTLLWFQMNFRIFFFLALQKTPLKSWEEFHWIYKTLWVYEHFDSTNSSNSWTQNIFIFIHSFSSFFHLCFIICSIQIFYLLV